MEKFNLSTLDITIMVLYAVFIIGYGIYRSKRKTSEEYFLGGRTLLWPVIGISLFAANISSSTLFGLAADAYNTNIHVFNYEWFAVVVLVFFAIFFMPFYLSSKVYTMPEFLERRYDSRSRYYFSFVTLVANIIVDAAAALYAGMLVFKILFPELDTWMIVVGLAVAAGAYTIPGGLSSVVHTEVIQAVLLIIGSIFLTYFCFAQVGGWSGMIESLEAMRGVNDIVGNQSPEEIMSLVRPASDDYMPWTGLLVGVPILGFYFWATNQFMVQRVLSAKNLDHGRWGALFAGFLKLPVIFIMVLPGLMALILYNDLDISLLNYATPDGPICTNLADCPNMTYPVLLFQLLPSGILGLVLAGLLAAMMSSVAATFNSASTLFTMDFLTKWMPSLDSKGQVRAGQIVTLALVVLAAAWAPQIERFDSLFEYLQLVISFTCPPVVAVFILGLFWKRANGSGAIAGLLTGFALAITMLLIKTMAGDVETGIIGFLNSIHFLHMAFFLLLIAGTIQVVVSLMTPPPADVKINGYTWNKEVFDADTEELKGVAWYKNYRILSILLLIVTAVLVGYFW